MRIIDISLSIHPDMFIYPGDPGFRSSRVYSFRNGDDCEVSKLTIGTHCGTHVDAPLHMIPGGAPLEQLPLDCFVGPCRVLTLPHSVISERMLADAQVQPGERILLRTAPNPAMQEGIRSNPAAISLRAAQYLAQQGVRLVGIDSPSIENVDQYAGQVHRTLLQAGIPILEGLDLREAADEKYFLSAMPLYLMGENGSPCRAVLIQE